MDINDHPRCAIKKTQPKVIRVLRVSIGWSIETYVEKLTKIQTYFYLFISILGAKISIENDVIEIKFT
jgi:hypothetical protein